ncbi:MAG: BON domain-containing protein, partial [Planctomycetia bacterium]|nr:BON domain-containing protein [Planctomycetia bacterium]
MIEYRGRHTGSNVGRLPILCLFRNLGKSTFILSLVASGFVCSAAFATEPSVASGSQSNSGSTLDSVSANGRIGGYRYDGTLHATPTQNSRFSSSARYGDTGNVTGLSAQSSGSRFNGSGTGTRFQSKIDYSLLQYRNELNRLRQSEGDAPDMVGNDRPRMVVATPPPRTPYATERRARYGLTPEQVQAQRVANAALQNQDGIASAVNPAPSPTVPAPQVIGSPRGVWMRGSAGLGTSIYSYGFDGSPTGVDGLFQYAPSNINQAYPPYDPGYSEYPDYVPNGLHQSQLGGGSLTIGSPETASAVAFPPVSDPAQVQRAFVEYLEAQLLRSPEVNPLSPIQVSFQDGVATIRGVVPTPSARLTAGRILLTDPRVSKVNNLLTYVRPDDASATAPGATSSVNNLQSSQTPQTPQ